MTKYNLAELCKKEITEKYKAVNVALFSDIDVEVKPLLNFKELLIFVKDIVDICFDSDTGEYLPEVTDFSIKRAILDNYTNIELPQDIHSIYDCLYCTDIIKEVTDVINSEQLSYAINSAKEKINHRAQANVEHINRQAANVADGFARLELKMEEVFNGVDKDSIDRLSSAVVNGSFDEAKLIKALKESDVHSEE